MLLRGCYAVCLYTETAGNKNISFVWFLLKFKLTETHGSFYSLWIARKTIQLIIFLGFISLTQSPLCSSVVCLSFTFSLPDVASNNICLDIILICFTKDCTLFEDAFGANNLLAPL